MDFVASILQFMLTNFGLLMLAISFLCIVIQSIHRQSLDYNVIYQWIALFPLGMTALYAFALHAFFPELAAENIGWQSSPFQFEVAMANLSIGVIGVYSAFQGRGFRLATVMAATCLLWGCAVGHVYQMITQDNFSPGNAGSWFYMDMFVPLILIICLIKQPANVPS